MKNRCQVLIQLPSSVLLGVFWMAHRYMRPLALFVCLAKPPREYIDQRQPIKAQRIHESNRIQHQRIFDLQQIN